MPRVSTGFLGLFALILAAGLVEIFVVGPLYFDRFLIEGLMMSLTLQAGHVAWTYFIVGSDPELRRRFPWLAFAAVNAALLLLFWRFGKVLHVSYLWETAVVYNFLRLYHDTQQGYGVSSLLLSDYEVGGAPASAALRGFLRPMQAISLLGLAVSGYMNKAETRLVVAAVSVPLTCWLFYRMLKKLVPEGESWHRSPVLQAALPLGRFTLLGMGSASLLVRTLLRMTHGVEYAYVFFRFCRDRKWAFFAGAIAVAMAVQLVELRAVAQFSEPFVGPAGRLSSIVLHTLAVSHIFQDWYLFHRDKGSAARLRGLWRGATKSAGGGKIAECNLRRDALISR